MKTITKRIAALMLILSLCILCAACSIQTSTSTSKGFQASFTDMKSDQTGSCELKEGDKLDAKIENKSGSFSITVGILGEEPIYQNGDAKTESFTLEIPKTGTYMFCVSGQGSSGSVSFTCK